MSAAGVLAALLWATAGVHALVALGLEGAFAWFAAAGVGLALLILKAARVRSPASAPRAKSELGDRAAYVGAALLATALLAAPIVDAACSAPTAHDAVHIWLPKFAEALEVAPPDLRADRWFESHPEYPRGFPLLAAAVVLPGPRDGRTLALTGAALAWLGLLVAYETAARFGNRLGGFAAVLAIGALPAYARHAGSGYADSALAAAGLVAAAGLSRDETRPRRPWIALGGAVGAAVLKEEGAAVLAATCAILAGDVFRGRARATLPALLCAVALFAPWAALRADAPPRGTLFVAGASANAGAVWLRAESAALEILHLAFALPDPSPDGPDFGGPAPGRDPLWWLLAAAVVYVAVRGARPFDVRPAALQLALLCGAFALTPEPLDWHVATAANRLALHAAPPFLAAAAFLLTARRPPRAPAADVAPAAPPPASADAAEVSSGP